MHSIWIFDKENLVEDALLAVCLFFVCAISKTTFGIIKIKRYCFMMNTLTNQWVQRSATHRSRDAYGSFLCCRFMWFWQK